MQGPWAENNESLNKTQSVVVAESLTDFPISKEFPLTSRLALAVSILASTTTVTNAITVKLQTSYQKKSNGDRIWVDVSGFAVAPTASVPELGYTMLGALGDVDLDGIFPLGEVGRVVATTGVDDTTTITRVLVQQPSR